MSALDPLVAYLVTLAIIQPARVQDVEASVPSYMGDRASELVKSRVVREMHETAKKTGLIVQIRKGLYALSPTGNAVVRTGALSDQIDNRRLFLIKSKRKAIK